jgi:hypothetical protein
MVNMAGIVSSVAALIFLVYGWSVGGVLGAVTGGTTAFLVGGEVALAFRPSIAGLLPQPLTALGTAILVLMASGHGGWQWGWLWALGAFFGATILTMVINVRLVRSRQGTRT